MQTQSIDANLMESPIQNAKRKRRIFRKRRLPKYSAATSFDCCPRSAGCGIPFLGAAILILGQEGLRGRIFAKRITKARFTMGPRPGIQYSVAHSRKLQRTLEEPVLVQFGRQGELDFAGTCDKPTKGARGWRTEQRSCISISTTPLAIRHEQLIRWAER